MKHVVLLIESSGAYGRGILRGIARFNRANGGWLTWHRPRGLTDEAPKWLSKWRGDGMLVRIKSPAIIKASLELGIPIVNLREALNLPFPYVAVDNSKVAEMAAQHLMERGFKQFAFCGRPHGTNISLDERAVHFRRVIEAAGYHCDSYFANDPTETADWEDEQDTLANWLKSLPKPVGIMACNDERGVSVLDACRRAGVKVPDEVAVIGVDNDEPLCDLAIPPMSSVDVNPEAVGFEGAQLLDRMMNGEKPPRDPVRLAPRGVVVRRSTDVIASEDSEVNEAIRYIRENACKGLQVSDVLMHLGISRAAMQQRMKKITGHTLHQEIQRVRMSRAKELLMFTDKTIKQVARESGFTSVQYMTRVFHAITGETPAKYRASRAK